MNKSTIATIIFPALAGIIILGVCVYVTTGDRLTREITTSFGLEEDPYDGKLVPSKTGPYPKLVVDNSTYDFDTMEVNTKTEHTFKVTNEGEAPLNIVNGGSTCQCTISDLPQDEVGVLQPGESKDVTLTISPVAETDSFEKYAIIKSNDPENEEVKLIVKGVVTSKYSVFPKSVWSVGNIEEGKGAEFSGVIFTKVYDSFEITKLESTDPHMTVSKEPLPEEAMKDLEAKSGYEIKVKIAPNIVVGEFKARINYKLSIEDNESFIEVTAYRAGTLIMRGEGWYAREKLVEFGTFKADTGKEIHLVAYIDKTPDFSGPFEMTKIEADPSYVDFSMEPYESATSDDLLAYKMTFKIPPNIAPDVRSEYNASYLKVKTNHPEMPVIKFKIRFSAQ